MRTLLLSKTILRLAFVIFLVSVLYYSKAREVATETWNNVSDEIQFNLLHGEIEGSGADRIDILESIDEMYSESEAVEENEYSESEEVVEEKEPIHFAMEDKKLLFHNKLPKSGSSTMKYILKVLSDKNDFFFDHYRVKQCDIDNNQRLVNHAAKLRRQHPEKKIALLKHHTWVNFTHRGYPQPQFINVVRHPVTQFKSRYYFSRYGWGLEKGKRRSFKGTHNDRKRSLDECVAQGLSECMDAVGVFNKYFCGTEPVCLQLRSHQQVEGKWVREPDMDLLAKATEHSKLNILKYRQIGILEEFDATLKLFEKTIPEFYAGATEAYHGPYVQKFVKLTRSKSIGNMTEETAHKLGKLLKYDMDIYNLAKQVFHQRLQENGIGRNAVNPL